jgi:hypothetical protein
MLPVVDQMLTMSDQVMKGAKNSRLTTAWLGNAAWFFIFQKQINPSIIENFGSYKK